MFLFPYLRDKKIKPLLSTEKKLYNGKNNQKISKYQLNKFNKLWKEIQKNVPYYNKLVKTSELPKKIKKWEDFMELPIGDRSFMRENVKEFSDTKKKPDRWINTGGSTGTPLNYPKWDSESKYNEANTWYARTFYNIKRSDKMFRLWGHSHTLGKGLSKYKNLIKLKIGHSLIGYTRFSAYDLSEENLKLAGEEILKSKPDYIIGYSKALNLLAQYNQEKRDDFHNLNLKAIIGAAEGFDKESDKTLVSDVFGCDVGLQYSSMETYLMAHTNPSEGYKVLWGNNLLECVDEEGNPAKTGRVLVTTLYPRAFPLVRYEIGDIIVNTTKDGHSVYEFEEVQGRDNDFLKLDDKTTIHSEAISHAIKYSDKITAYQIRYTKDSKHTIYLISNEIITEKDKNEIQKRLSKIDERLSKINVEQADMLKQTIAGKTKWLIEE